MYVNRRKETTRNFPKDRPQNLETSQSGSNTTRHNLDSISGGGDRLLDKNEEKERKVKDGKSATDLEAVVLPVASEYGKALKETLDELERYHADFHSLIEQDAKSMFRNKSVCALSHTVELEDYIYRIARISLIAYVSDDYLNRKLGVLEDVIKVVIRQIKDLPSPEDVKELHGFSTRKTELDLLMNKLKELTDQAEKEKAEAFKKIDRARQQVLKDVV
jgi:hypothetical protein